MSNLSQHLKYSSLGITQTTQYQRGKIKTGMDDFCTFSWCNVDAWEEFGAFIINAKEDLKFYNGPQFSNSYAQPQYNTSALLEGVSFKTQQIKFKIGVYWISDQDYRRFINWLNPYAIGTLVFKFNEDWGYQVKLANREDSTRYVVGYELENGISKRRYYTEMTLTFEVQGQACAIATQAYEYTEISSIENGYNCTINPNGKQDPSDLPIPFKMTISFPYIRQNITFQPLQLFLKYQDEEQGVDINTLLFELNWSNDFITNALGSEADDYSVQTLWLEYDSESGIIYQKYGDGQYKLLNLWSLNELGSKVLKTIYVKKFLIPGKFNNPTIDMSKITFSVQGLNTINENGIYISIKARTNVI